MFLRSHFVLRLGVRKFTTQVNNFETGIEIYSCVARKNVPLILKNQILSTWYTCGPTVYDSTHIGHASCYVKLDIIQRILRNYFNINLVTAMNITDIDDKIIKKSQEMQMDWKALSEHYEKEFWNDLKKLKVKDPNIKVQVTENIPLILSFISEILKKDQAYVSKDNSVYFKVNTYPAYGKLQNLNLDKIEHEFKDAAQDFALWKAQKPNEPHWDSPWGKGRPGWHIECSALASKLFGSSIDFHAGGQDLKFPHHENEEAQSCSYHNCNQWVNYWLHTGHLNLRGDSEKMSKSLKNTISVSELLEKYSGDEFRMACILSNYRNSMEYSDELMATARNTLAKFNSFDSDCSAYIQGAKAENSIDSNLLYQKLSETKAAVDKALKNDFDTAKTVKHLSDLTSAVCKAINTRDFTSEILNASNKEIIVASHNFVGEILNMFGLNEKIEQVNTGHQSFDVTEFIDDIIKIRKQFRAQGIATKNTEIFKICDQIRDTLTAHGIEIKDHDKNSSWSFIK